MRIAGFLACSAAARSSTELRLAMMPPAMTVGYRRTSIMLRDRRARQTCTDAAPRLARPGMLHVWSRQAGKPYCRAGYADAPLAVKCGKCHSRTHPRCGLVGEGQAAHNP